MICQVLFLCYLLNLDKIEFREVQSLNNIGVYLAILALEILLTIKIKSDKENEAYKENVYWEPPEDGSKFWGIVRRLILPVFLTIGLNVSDWAYLTFLDAIVALIFIVIFALLDPFKPTK